MLRRDNKRYIRHKRTRAKVSGSSKRPRLCVFRSNKYIYAQLIDDEKGKILLSLSDFKLKEKTKTAAAHKVGELLAQKAIEKKIKKVVFDKAGYKYHGRVQALAQGAREGGLQF